jgi:hypothetical protein
MSLLLLPLTLLLAATPAVRDTTATATVRGVVLILNDPSGGPERAVVLLAEALPLGKDRVWSLAVAGKARRMERWSGRFIEATGAISGAPPDTVWFTPSGMKEIEADGSVRREVDLSLSQHAVVTVAVVPPRFDVPPNGRGNQISPVVLYKIANHGQADLDFMFSNNEFVCVGLLRAGDTSPRWSDVWKVSQPSPRLTIRIGSVFRAVVPIPPNELAWPDRYTVQATLCGVREYAVTVPLQVTGR